MTATTLSGSDATLRRDELAAKLANKRAEIAQAVTAEQHLRQELAAADSEAFAASLGSVISSGKFVRVPLVGKLEPVADTQPFDAVVKHVPSDGPYSLVSELSVNNQGKLSILDANNSRIAEVNWTGTAGVRARAEANAQLFVVSDQLLAWIEKVLDNDNVLMDLDLSAAGRLLVRRAKFKPGPNQN